MIKILIVDDHTLFRQGLTEIFKTQKKHKNYRPGERQQRMPFDLQKNKAGRNTDGYFASR